MWKICVTFYVIGSSGPPSTGNILFPEDIYTTQAAAQAAAAIIQATPKHPNATNPYIRVDVSVFQVA
jgi:hypothetical protein